MKDKKENKENNGGMLYMPLGMCIGISIGVGLGAAMKNIPLWMSIGLCIGLAIGGGIDAANRTNAENNSETDEKTKQKEEK